MDTQQARQTLADIEARHEDIMKLEKSIREVHDLFVDMAVLIEKQGDKIDSIESHVTNTRSFVEKAVEQTSKALVYQGKARTVSPCFTCPPNVTYLIYPLTPSPFVALFSFLILFFPQKKLICYGVIAVAVIVIVLSTAIPLLSSGDKKDK